MNACTSGDIISKCTGTTTPGGTLPVTFKCEFIPQHGAPVNVTILCERLCTHLHYENWLPTSIENALECTTSLGTHIEVPCEPTQAVGNAPYACHLSRNQTADFVRSIFNCDMVEARPMTEQASLAPYYMFGAAAAFGTAAWYCDPRYPLAKAALWTGTAICAGITLAEFVWPKSS
jgi:hypothetical protein